MRLMGRQASRIDPIWDEILLEKSWACKHWKITNIYFVILVSFCCNFFFVTLLSFWERENAQKSFKNDSQSGKRKGWQKTTKNDKETTKNEKQMINKWLACWWNCVFGLCSSAPDPATRAGWENDKKMPKKWRRKTGMKKKRQNQTTKKWQQ